MTNLYEPVIIYFCAGGWRSQFPVGELRYPIFLVSKRWRVIFVEPPITLPEWVHSGKRIQFYRHSGSLRHIPETKLSIFTPHVLLPYSVRLPLPHLLKKTLLNLNIKRISKQVLQCFRHLFSEKALPDIVWGTIFHHTDFFHYVRGRHNLAIIDDNFPLSPVFTPHQQSEIAKMESCLIRRSDYIFTTSQTLFEEKRKLNPNNVLMENGVSELFLPENRPRLKNFIDEVPRKERHIIERIETLPHPRIGYVGAINIRLWKPILYEILKLPLHFHTIFVGNIDDSFSRPLLTEMRKNPRVHFFPYISHALIPDLLEQFDVLLLPFELTPFSRFINPLKLSEYLTSGKPIVSTRITEVVRIASQPEGMVYFIDSPETFRQSIERAIAEDSPTLHERRIDLARLRTWERTTTQMLSIVEKLLEKESRVGDT